MLAPPSLDQLTFVIVPLSIEIPFDNPTKPTIRLDSPHASKTHSWDPTIFDEDKMTHVIQMGYDVPLLIRWLYKRMCASDTYLIERSHKRVRSDEWSNMNDFKMMKMDIDE
jgi:hypothetical protein